MDHLRSRHTLAERPADLDPEEALERLRRRPDESDREFAGRAVDVLHRSIVHGIDHGHLAADRWHLPPEENLLIHLGARLLPRLSYYPFCDHERAVWRGVGLCGQHARALTSVLRAGGVNADPVPLPNHVVVEADLDGDPHVLDSHLNTVVPHGINSLVEDPELVRPHYRGTHLHQRDDLNETELDNVVDEVYGGRASNGYHYLRALRVLKRLGLSLFDVHAGLERLVYLADGFIPDTMRERFKRGDVAWGR